jgi:hypothetical protein
VAPVNAATRNSGTMFNVMASLLCLVRDHICAIINLYLTAHLDINFSKCSNRKISVFCFLNLEEFCRE